MKLLIKPTAAHMYRDFTNGQEVQAFRPSVVVSTQFIQGLLAAQKVTLLSNEVKAEATDEEFAKFFKASDRKEQLAIDSFMSKFSSKPEVVKEEAPKVAKAEAPKVADKKD